MPMMKHISALVYVAMFMMLFGVQQLKRDCSVQRSWECEGQICNPHPMRSISITDTSSSWTHFYHTDLITAKESNHKNKAHKVKTAIQ